MKTNTAFKGFAAKLCCAAALCFLALLTSSCAWEKEFTKKINTAMSDKDVTAIEFAILKKDLADNLPAHPEGVTIGGMTIRSEHDLIDYFHRFGINGTAPELSAVEAPFSKLYVMLENSASMEGYSKSANNRDFSTPIIALWNSVGKETEVVTGYAHHNDKSECEFEQVEERKFQSDLTTARIRIATSSPIDQILGYAAGHTDESSVAAIITDGIMSGTNDEILSTLPGRMWTYNNMPVLEQRVRNAMELAHQKNLAFSVYRFEAPFNGTYYNFKNLKQKMQEVERPFFIILLGTEKYVRQMDGKLLADDRKFDYEDHLSSYEIADLKAVKNGLLSVVPTPGINMGDFNMSPAKGEIKFKSELNFPVNLSLKVTIPPTLPESIADDDFLEDNARLISADPTTNREIDLTSMLRKVEEDEKDPGKFNFIMEVAPDFANVISGEKELRLTVPVSYENLYRWYVEDSVDSDVEPDWDTEKTFALSNMIESFFKGYDTQTTNVVDIKILLKK